MKAQDLRNLLEQSDDKFSILSSSEIFRNYRLTVKGFLGLISEFLNDEEKDSAIKQLLHNQDYIKKHKIGDYKLYEIISILSESARIEILQDTDLVANRLHLSDDSIAVLIKGLSDEDEKKTMLETYKLPNNLKVYIMNTLNSDTKIDILLKQDSFNKYYRIEILRSLDIENLSKFLKQHRDFCSENDIHPYEIICKLEAEQQKDFVTRLEEINLTLIEKREILAALKAEVKQSIDTTNFPEEYKSALSIQTTEYGKIVSIDFARTFEDYRGLDNLMRINPEEFTEEQRAQFMKLLEICPNLQVVNTINNSGAFVSTTSEYKEAEEWISSIIDKLNPEYSQAQKMAIIDNEIGKKISYSPDFDTEVFDSANCRALWKIISSGYGVCNGIARVEQYILNRVGIESEIIGGFFHSFLKIKDIELPLANGEFARGNTILDPTWNLTSHRFGGQPNNFCISYEQARKNDIDAEGKDHNCHKNDEQLQDATLNLDEESLRELFKSVGLADKDGQFPIKDLLEKSKQLDEFYANQPDKNISKQFLLLRQTCPEFATCQNSAMSILSYVLLSNKNLKFNKCVVNRVYNRTDKEKRPILFVYIDSNELGSKFFFANNDGEFLELPQEEFIKRFECYEEDLKMQNRIQTMGE